MLLLFFCPALLILVTAAGALACETFGQTAAGLRYEACVVDPARYVLTLHWRTPDDMPYESLSRLWESLKSRGLNPVYATNAGIFGQDGTPLGLHVEGGRVLHPLNLAKGKGNFFLRPNGVFFVATDGTAGILESQAYARLHPAAQDIRLATQSGPLLVVDGRLNPRFHADGTSRYRRNGVGVRSDGVVVLARSLEACNLYEFADLFRTTLGARSALYLDGSTVDSVSRDHGPNLSFAEFVGMLAVTEKPPATQ